VAEGDLIKTGIRGLDSILLGGIRRTNVIVVQGVIGSGKTLLGMEFIYRGVVEFNKRGLIIVFEANPDKLIRDAVAFGWNLEELQRQGNYRLSSPVRKCSNRNCTQPTACCWKPRRTWALSGSL
jgi:KaiC/GvpD/RAD55 family RecA-like ATPase